MDDGVSPVHLNIITVGAHSLWVHSWGTLTAHLEQSSNGKVLPEGQWDAASCVGALTLCPGWVLLLCLCSWLLLSPSCATSALPQASLQLQSKSLLPWGSRGQKSPVAGLALAAPPAPTVLSLPLQVQPWGPGESCWDLSVLTTICSSLPWR